MRLQQVHREQAELQAYELQTRVRIAALTWSHDLHELPTAAYTLQRFAS